jgi:hypothetical protein
MHRPRSDHARAAPACRKAAPKPKDQFAVGPGSSRMSAFPSCDVYGRFDRFTSSPAGRNAQIALLREWTRIDARGEVTQLFRAMRSYIERAFESLIRIKFAPGAYTALQGAPARLQCFICHGAAFSTCVASISSPQTARLLSEPIVLSNNRRLVIGAETR